MAFRVALALFPAIALLVWIGGRTVGPDEARSLIGTLLDLVPDASRSIVKTAVDASLQNNPADGGAEAPWLGTFAPAIGVAVTLWTANSGMKALFAALNIVYDEEENRGFLRRNLVTLAFTSGTLMLLVLSTVALLASPVMLSRLGLGDLATTAVHWLRWPALFVGFALTLSLLYRYAPNRARRRAHWPLVTVGSVVAAGLLVLGTALFSWFATRFLGLSATYGSLSTVMAFLIWAVGRLSCRARLRGIRLGRRSADWALRSERASGAERAELTENAAAPLRGSHPTVQSDRRGRFGGRQAEERSRAEPSHRDPASEW